MGLQLAGLARSECGVMLAGRMMLGCSPYTWAMLWPVVLVTPYL